MRINTQILFNLKQCLLRLIVPLAFLALQGSSNKVTAQDVPLDTTSIIELRTKAKEWQHNNSDSSVYYYRQAINEITRLITSLSGEYATNHPELPKRLDELLARSNIDLGNELFWKGEYDEALKCYNIALAKAKELQDIGTEGECYGEMATMYRNQGKYPEALRYNKMALDIADIIKDDYWKGILYNNRGVILQAIGDYPGALRSFFSALDLYKNQPDVYPNVELLNIGRIFELQGELDQALKYYRQSLEISQNAVDGQYRIAECYLAIGGIHLKNKYLLEARAYFTDALNILVKGGHDYRIDFCYSQIGESYFLEEDYDRAIEYFNKSLEISREKGEVATEGDTFLKLSQLHLHQNKIKPAKDYAQTALRIADTTGYLELKSRAYTQLTAIYEDIGDIDSAFICQKRNIIIQDSLFNDQKVRALADMETKYETERTEMELSLAQEQKNTAEQKLQRNRIAYLAIIISLALTSLLIIITFIFFQQRSKLKLQAYEQKQIILRREFEQKKSALQILTLKNQLNPHFIFNALNSIGSSIQKERKDKAYDLLTSFSDLVRATLYQADKISITLTQELDFVRNYLILEKNRFKNIFEYEIQISREVDREALIPRMAIQVFVENAIKHGLRYLEKDGKLDIIIGQDKGHLNITISDNGIGRKKASSMPSASTGKGLAIINEMFSIYEQLYEIQIGYNIVDKYDNNDSPEGTDILLTIPIIEHDDVSEA